MDRNQLWIKVAARLIVLGVIGIVIVLLALMTDSLASGSLMRVEIEKGFLAGRFSPSKRGALEVKLYNGDEIEISGITDNGWAIFIWGGDELYCDMSYLRPVENYEYEVVGNGKLNGRKTPGGKLQTSYKAGSTVEVLITVVDDDGVVWGYTSDSCYVNMEYLELK